MSSLNANQQRRVDHQLRLLAAVRAWHPGGAPPYFAHMRLETGPREVDVLLAASTHVGPSLSLIDWRTAPLAEVFFAYEEGEEYDIEVGERVVSGRLLEKNLLGFEAGALAWIDTGEETRLEYTGTDWRRSEDTLLPQMTPRPAAARQPFRSPLEVRLDAAQQRVVDLPRNRSVLLLGEAGFGKTTVALHRLVELQREAGPGFRGAVLVPTEGLSRLTRLMLERRGVEGIDVWTYARWAASMARRVFKDLPRRESVDATSGVIRLKRHPALRGILEEFIQRHPKPVRDEDRPTSSRARASRVDLEHLFGDRSWMERVLCAMAGALPPSVAAEVTEHTRIQFLDPTEIEYAHVDRENLVTVDGQRIDAGTPMEDADSVDTEDYAVLFELERLRTRADGAKPGALAAYDCMVIDEAQEFAPLELALLRRGLRPGGTFIVAGDAAQQVDPTSFFGGWDAVLEELAVPTAERAVLEVSYRCPDDVTALARSLIDPERVAPRDPPSITHCRRDNLFHLAVWLTRESRALLTEDPSASLAIICRSPEAARTFAQALRHGPPARLALAGQFEFRPGLTVTCVQEIKGLEFDYVLIPDATASTYPDTPESRRALYVAVTRATHRLGLGSAGAWSPLLTSAPR
ncbi:ATP-binding domain-containing protein [Cystobacter fuscus]|uniref:ATP-binding domain-containing protein n=1 Tax=Cystobacter fuscus TaxID=43 RepID=UPI002B2DC741|nr:AAA family ATPase [Cystobacter fuscus]